MRWFVIFLLLANIALYFWVQQQSRPAHETVPLTAPDVGHLRLLRDELATGTAAIPGGRQAQAVPDSVTDPSATGTPAAAAPAVAAEPVDAAANEATKSPPTLIQVEPPVSPAVAPKATESASVAAVETMPAEPPVDEVAKQSDTEVQVQEQVNNRVSEPGPAVAAVTTESVELGAPSLEVPEPLAVIESAVAKAAEAASRPAMACRKVGPLDDDQANGLIANLADSSTVLNDDNETYRQADGYYVMIPPLPSRVEGRAMLQRLNDAGITDTWLFRSGENRNAISLGLFSRKSSADRHAATITGKGFVPEVRERQRELSGRFLVIGTTADGAVGEDMKLPGSASAVTVDCPSP